MFMKSTMDGWTERWTNSKTISTCFTKYDSMIVVKKKKKKKKVYQNIKLYKTWSWNYQLMDKLKDEWIEGQESIESDVYLLHEKHVLPWTLLRKEWQRGNVLIDPETKVPVISITKTVVIGILLQPTAWYNGVMQHWPQLVLGWVTVFQFPNNQWSMVTGILVYCFVNFWW